MGQVGSGLVYLIFFWTSISALIAFVELFLIGGRVDRYNDKKAQDSAMRIWAMQPQQQTPHQQVLAQMQGR